MTHKGLLGDRVTDRATVGSRRHKRGERNGREPGTPTSRTSAHQRESLSSYVQFISITETTTGLEKCVVFSDTQIVFYEMSRDHTQIRVTAFCTIFTAHAHNW